MGRRYEQFGGLRGAWLLCLCVFAVMLVGEQKVWSHWVE